MMRDARLTCAKPRGVHSRLVREGACAGSSATAADSGEERALMLYAYARYAGTYGFGTTDGLTLMTA
jgi:hypothetical protein